MPADLSVQHFLRQLLLLIPLILIIAEEKENETTL